MKIRYDDEGDRLYLYSVQIDDRKPARLWAPNAEEALLKWCDQLVYGRHRRIDCPRLNGLIDADTCGLEWAEGVVESAGYSQRHNYSVERVGG